MIGNKFEQWQLKHISEFGFVQDPAKAFQDAFNAGVESTKEKRFGCFYNCQIFDNCVLDNLGRGDSCDRSHLVTRREECSRWREIK